MRASYPSANVALLAAHIEASAGISAGRAAWWYLGALFVGAMLLRNAGRPAPYANVFIVNLNYVGILVCANMLIIVARARMRSRVSTDKIPAI